jgi:hypothetical protein
MLDIDPGDGKDAIAAIVRLLVEQAEEGGPEQALKEAQSGGADAPDAAPSTTMNLTLF